MFQKQFFFYFAVVQTILLHFCMAPAASKIMLLLMTHSYKGAPLKIQFGYMVKCGSSSHKGTLSYYFT